MPRARRVRRLFPIAVTANELRVALGVSLRSIENALLTGELVAHQGPGRRLILVADVVAWVRTLPIAKKRKYQKRSNSNA